jgi:CDP-diacylglycerol---serine O-phosphatidyltransferase
MNAMHIRRGGFLPNLFTLGNGICGFAAIVKVMKVDVTAGAFDETASGLFVLAAWLILFGMVFDVFDGKIARLTGRTSDLGAQLDSLCDLTTFGMAPAILVVRLNMIYHPAWGKAVWLFALAYFLGALLRLARFNAENDHDPSAHLCFKGLPSPAAAGCVASLVIFYFYIQKFTEDELTVIGRIMSKESIQGLVHWIPYALPVLLLVLGYTMVSTRLRYAHVASQILNRRLPFQFLVSLIFGAILAAYFREIALPVIFIGYLAWTPATALAQRIRGKRAPAGGISVEAPGNGSERFQPGGPEGRSSDGPSS